MDIDKFENFSEWFDTIIKEGELADLRYNLKGFVVYRPWSVLAMRKMFLDFEEKLMERGHQPTIFPALIPERNFEIEKEHVAGFTPEVFWVTKHGDDEEFEEKLALRPTSETAFYSLYRYWIQGKKDLPLKLYQVANVWRYETKATRPFLRAREFYWIEAHCAFATKEEAIENVKEDLRTSREIIKEKYGVPILQFQRPEWDKFAGAVNTYVSECILPNGRFIQLPSTHYLGEKFSKAFSVKYKDENNQEKYVHITCFGPAMTRILAATLIVHGDNRGMRMPFCIAPEKAIIIPILSGEESDKKIISICQELSKKLNVKIDLSEKSLGEKRYFWELKGVPFRIEIGKKEVKEGFVTLFRRDLNKKEKKPISEMTLEKINSLGKEYDENLKKQAEEKTKEVIQECHTLEEIEKAIENKKCAKFTMCSIDKDGEKCAEVLDEKGIKIRGKLAFLEEKPFGKCPICGREGRVVVYAGKQY